MEIAKAFLEVLAYPAVVLILGLVVINRLTPVIKAKLHDIKKVGAAGVLIDMQPDQVALAVKTEELPAALGSEVARESTSSQESPSTETPQKSFERLMRQPITATVLTREELIGTRLDALGLQPDQVRQVLVRGLAATNVELEFERAARLMFGSQLELLVMLTTAGGATKAEVEAVFDQAKSMWPELHKDRPMERWLHFLTEFGLIEIADDGVSQLTQVGVDFLAYLAERRLGHQRSG